MQPNPYTSPQAEIGDDREATCDRTQRDALATTIRRYLEEQITAFEFDEALDEFRRSGDPTVRHVAFAVWYFYDDCKDHLVNLNKPAWDYFQRMLLLLESDRTISTTRRRRWSWTQLPAVACLGVFGWLVWRYGFGMHLLAFAMPLGVVSIGIAAVRSRMQPTLPYEAILVPFGSFAELSETYRSAPKFAKRRYPGKALERPVHSRLAHFGMWLRWYALWLMFAPIPLLAQSFPLVEVRTNIGRA